VLLLGVRTRVGTARAAPAHGVRSFRRSRDEANAACARTESVRRVAAFAFYERELPGMPCIFRSASCSSGGAVHVVAVHLY
jgi:hypothetical protein